MRAAWVVPAAVMLFCAVLLNSGEVLKRPMSQAEDIPGGLARMEQSVTEGRWEQASQYLGEVSRALDLVRPRIELGVERLELERFHEEVALLRGSLAARDTSSSLQHIALLRVLYDGLGR